MHECPECYSACLCSGDIDDMLLGAFGGCGHCDDIGVTFGPDDELDDIPTEENR